jgi:hypothetical protein
MINGRTERKYSEKNLYGANLPAKILGSINVEETPML